MEKTSKCRTDIKMVSSNVDDLPSAKKTMDLFNKAREALNNPDSNNYKNEILSSNHQDHQKVREILPKKNTRNALWRKEEVTSENANKSGKPKTDIPFSKNRYEKEGENTELIQENKKKAIRFLKKQKEEKVRKEQEKRRLMERKKSYNEQVRRLNREKLKNTRRRNCSPEQENSDMKKMRHSTSIRSKSEELKGKY